MNDQHPVHYEDPYAVGPPRANGIVREAEWRDSEEEGGSLGTYFLSIYRHKWLIAFATFLGVIGAVVAWNLIEVRPSYTAQGSLWLQVGGGERASGPIQAADLLPATSYRDLLLSMSVLEPVVYEQKLYLRPGAPDDIALFDGFELTGDPVTSGAYIARAARGGTELVRGDEVVDFARAGQPVGASLGFRWRPPAGALAARPVAFSLASPRDTALRLQRTLVPQMDQRGVILYIQWTAPSPQRAADVVNAVMERHVELAEELMTASLQQEYETLEEQLAFARSELDAAESALESFRVTTVTLPSDQPIQAGLEMTRGPVFNSFFEMQTRREAVRRDRERLQEAAAAHAAGGELRVESLEIVSSVANSAQLQEALNALVAARAERRGLLETYTQEHPLVQAVEVRIAGLEEQQVPRLVSQLVQQLQIEEDVLSQQIEASEAELSRIPARAIEEAQLSRTAQMAASFYANLQNRFQIANLQRASAVPDVSILDRAAPPEYASQGTPRGAIALAVFGLFIGLGLAGAIVWDKFDPRLRSPDEIATTFGLNVLAIIPRIERVSRGRGLKSHTAKNVSQLREAFRELRTNLTFAYGSAGPFVATVSSSDMSEGKTTITTNLAVSFAELGKRTLLIDGDTRRGDMHEYLNGRRKPGLTDFLRGDITIEQVVQETAHEGLDFIGSGTQCGNSPELLSSNAMGNLMAMARKEYDVVLVDSPPLGAGADALVLATITGHLVLVIRSGSTNKEFTLAKVEPLGRLPVRQLGVVVNDYEPSRIEAYRYYSSYLPGYEAGAEEGGEWKASDVPEDRDARLGAGRPS